MTFQFWSSNPPFLKSRKPLSSDKNCESSTGEGPLDGFSILYVFDGQNLGIKIPILIGFFEILKIFIVDLERYVGRYVGRYLGRNLERNGKQQRSLLFTVQ